MTLPTSTVTIPLWLRLWSWLTVALCLPLAVAGAETTTKGVGMADQQGLRHPGYLFLRETDVPGEPMRIWHLWESSQYGLLIEHGHRFFGFVVGISAIVLCLGLLVMGRGWHRWLGLVALLAVSSQGLLGIFRVNLNAILGQSLATVHGATAQLVFATLVAVAVLCSRTWTNGANKSVESATLRRGAIALSALVYVQIVFGAIVRHLLQPVFPVAQRLHILLAFAVLGAVFWLLAQVRRGGLPKAIVRPTLLLVILVCIQPILGVEAWIQRFGAGTLPELVGSSTGSDLVRSGHHVLGTLIFATTVAVAVLLHRANLRQPSVKSITEQAAERGMVTRELEGVA